VGKPQSMGAEERILLVAEFLLDEVAAVEDWFSSKLLGDPPQEFPRLVERHLIARSFLEVESHKRLVVGLRGLEKIVHLL